MPGCEETTTSPTGYCKRHYFKDWYERNRGLKTPLADKRHKNIDPSGMPLKCSFEGCDANRQNSGFCGAHYAQFRSGKEMRPLRHTDACPVEGCPNRASLYLGKTICARHLAFAKRFGLTEAECIEIWHARRCKNPACGTIDDLQYDHDHACCPGKVNTCGKCGRGWLCRGCNLALGAIGDDVRRLEGLIAYLSNYSAG